MSTTAIIRQALAVIAIACCIHLSECGEASQRRLEQEELDRQRFKQPFAYIFVSLFLAVSLPLFRFIHCICTDPLVPPLFRELKRRAARILNERFGTFGVVEKRVDIDIDDDDDEYVNMKSID
eukprot:scaffold3033_cov119-Skeletonema_dohrnii-CCMP3373.AAC.4